MLGYRDSHMASAAERLKALCLQHDLVALYSFGSNAVAAAEFVAKGGKIELDHPGADLDIGVLSDGDRRLSPRDKVGIAAALEDIFEVPRVDLVLLREASPFLALEIIRGERLVEIDSERTARYELFVLRRAGDLLFFERQRREMVLRGGAR